MREPTLVILAAGMGSRFGGLKQIMAVDDFGHAIIDFSASAASLSLLKRRSRRISRLPWVAARRNTLT